MTEASGTLYRVIWAIQDVYGPEIAATMEQKARSERYLTQKHEGRTLVLFMQCGVWWFHD